MTIVVRVSLLLSMAHWDWKDQYTSTVVCIRVCTYYVRRDDRHEAEPARVDARLGPRRVSGVDVAQAARVRQVRRKQVGEALVRTEDGLPVLLQARRGRARRGPPAPARLPGGGRLGRLAARLRHAARREPRRRLLRLLERRLVHPVEQLSAALAAVELLRGRRLLRAHCRYGFSAPTIPIPSMETLSSTAPSSRRPLLASATDTLPATSAFATRASEHMASAAAPAGERTHASSASSAASEGPTARTSFDEYFTESEEEPDAQLDIYTTAKVQINFTLIDYSFY